MSATCTEAIREISLTQGFIAIIDAADWPMVSRFKWHATKSSYGGFYYAAACVSRAAAAEFGTRHLRLHRYLMGFPAGLVDHRDGDRMNNRRSNLRCATFAGNARNARKQAGTSSRFKGVSWHKKYERWQVFIALNSRNKFLGHFTDELEAALVYDASARIHHGEFARLNFPQEVPA